MLAKKSLEAEIRQEDILHQEGLWLARPSSGRVVSAIEGIVFIDQSKCKIFDYPIFIGEVISFHKITLIGGVEWDSFLFLGMVLSLSVKSAEVMVFGDTSEISPNDF
jgi:hypothetical protein